MSEQQPFISIIGDNEVLISQGQREIPLPIIPDRIPLNTEERLQAALCGILYGIALASVISETTPENSGATFPLTIAALLVSVQAMTKYRQRAREFRIETTIALGKEFLQQTARVEKYIHSLNRKNP